MAELIASRTALVARRAARVCAAASRPQRRLQRVYGATVARLTPDQKVGSSNLSALSFTTLARPRDQLQSQVERPRADLNRDRWIQSPEC